MMKFLHQISQFDINEHLITKKLKSLHNFSKLKSMHNFSKCKINKNSPKWQNNIFFNMEWGYD